MKAYEERLAEATSIYEQGKIRAKNNPNPKKQKFPTGTRVHIRDDLGKSMSHFTGGINATVEYTYAQAYGGNNWKDYSLILDGKGSVAWYEEWQLTLVRINE